MGMDDGHHGRVVLAPVVSQKSDCEPASRVIGRRIFQNDTCHLSLAGVFAYTIVELS